MRVKDEELQREIAATASRLKRVIDGHDVSQACDRLTKALGRLGLTKQAAVEAWRDFFYSMAEQAKKYGVYMHGVCTPACRECEADCKCGC